MWAHICQFITLLSQKNSSIIWNIDSQSRLPQVFNETLKLKGETLKLPLSMIMLTFISFSSENAYVHKFRRPVIAVLQLIAFSISEYLPCQPGISFQYWESPPQGSYASSSPGKHLLSKHAMANTSPIKSNINICSFLKLLTIRCHASNYRYRLRATLSYLHGYIFISFVRHAHKIRIKRAQYIAEQVGTQCLKYLQDVFD